MGYDIRRNLDAINNATNQTLVDLNETNAVPLQIQSEKMGDHILKNEIGTTTSDNSKSLSNSDIISISGCATVVLICCIFIAGYARVKSIKAKKKRQLFLECSKDNRLGISKFPANYKRDSDTLSSSSSKVTFPVIIDDSFIKDDLDSISDISISLGFSRQFSDISEASSKSSDNPMESDDDSSLVTKSSGRSTSSSLIKWSALDKIEEGIEVSMQEGEGS